MLKFQFCGKAPALQICESDQPAYTSRMLYSRTTHEKQLLMDQMHCYCPEKHDYVMTHQTWQDPIPNVDTEVVELAYVCAPVSPQGFAFYIQDEKCMRKL